ncbi:MAG TPA: lipocalin-like domain-containing protein [Chloroflexota bacterium]|nr:lipocalin-like domain-containing protein [Chloroflexota bacterium]
MRVRAGRLVLAVGLILLGMATPVAAAPQHFKPIRLPADARMHPGAQNEWWYFTGHLRDARGHTYGFELTNFKFSGIRKLDPFSPVDTLYRIDFAITDEHARKFHSLIQYLMPAPGKTILSTKGLKSRMDAGNGSLALDTLPGPGLAYRLRGQMKAGSLDLVVRTTRRPLLEGRNGVESIANGYSYYYSLTNMQSSGTLTLGTHALAVTGLTWMDHQWGNWSWKDDKGWDWMAVQLANGTSFSLVNFISGHGQTFKYAIISFPSGKQMLTADARMSPLNRHWRSAATGTLYPAGWHVQVPVIGLDGIVLPTVPDQEMVDRSFEHVSYWEGSGRLTGTLSGAPITGLTYTELVGYGKQGGFAL